MSTVIDLSSITGGISFNLPDLANISTGIEGVSFQDALSGLAKVAGVGLASQLNPTFRSADPNAVTSLLAPVFDRLNTGITETFKQIQKRIITDLPLGLGADLQQRVAQQTFERFRAETGREFTSIADVSTIQDATQALFKQDDAIGSIISRLSDEEFADIAASTSKAFAALAQGAGSPEKLLEAIQVLARGVAGADDPVAAFKIGLDKLIRTSGSLSRQLRTPLGKTIELTTDQLKKLSFLGFNEATREAGKLALASRKFGIDFGASITKPLLTFKEAGDLASSLGAVLRGVNFDVNQFVAAKPSERARLALGELVSAFSDGRLQVEEDGVAFGQQVAIFQQALAGVVDPSKVELTLRQLRSGRLSEVLNVLEEGAVGTELSVEEVVEARRQAVPLEFATGRVAREAGAVALETGAVAPALGELVDGLQNAIDSFRQSGVLQATTPLVVELNKFAEFSKVFTKDGGFRGLIPFALFGNLGFEDFERSITRVTNNTDFQTLMTTIGEKGNKLTEVANDLSNAGKQVATELVSQVPEAIKKAFTSDTVVKAITDGYTQAAALAKNVILGSN